MAYKQPDAVTSLLNFIYHNINNDEYVVKQYGDLDGVYAIDKLFSQDELLRTDANEIPNSNETDWFYNGHSTYDLYYALLDNNKLLVISDRKDLSEGERIRISFRLYPNADKMHVNVRYGHSHYPYFTIYDETDKLVSEFSFERVHTKYKEESNLKLSDYINQVSLEELRDRYQNSNSFRK